MKDSRTPLARIENVVVQEMPDETLIYDLKTNKAYCLNQTAAIVWKNCDGKRSVAQIAEVLQEVSKTPVTDEVVWLAIDQLGKDNLLESKPEMPVLAGNGLSRREAIRRIGLASAIALPIVAALAVPSAAYAAVSCNGVACGAGGTCPSPCTCIPAGGPGTCSGPIAQPGDQKRDRTTQQR